MAWAQVSDKAQDIWVPQTRPAPACRLQLGEYVVPAPKTPTLTEPILDTEQKSGVSQSFTFPTGVALQLNVEFDESPTPITVEVENSSNLSGVEVVTDPDIRINLTVDAHASDVSTLVLRVTDANGVSGIVNVTINHRQDFADLYTDNSFTTEGTPVNTLVETDVLSPAPVAPLTVSIYNPGDSTWGLRAARVVNPFSAAILVSTQRPAAYTSKTGWVQYRDANGAYGYIEVFVERYI